MICTNCSGVFDDNEPKCPYCGTIHLPAAQRVYEEKLDDVLDDFEPLANVPIDEYKQEIVHQTKHAGRIVLIVVLVFAVLLGFIFATEACQDASYSKRDLKAEILWEQTTFPMLSALYDEGKYDELLAFEDDLRSQKDNPYSIYGWEHYYFLAQYRAYDDMLFEKDLLSKVSEDYQPSSYPFKDILYTIFTFKPDAEYQKFTDADLVRIEGYHAEMRAFLQEFLHMTDADYEDLQEKIYNDGNFDSTAAYDYIEERLEQK